MCFLFEFSKNLPRAGGGGDILIKFQKYFEMTQKE